MDEVSAGDISILQAWNEVEAYVDAARNASDSNKKSLGFLPTSVFSGHARRNQLFVAVHRESGEYRGHLLFDLKFPHATVLQMYADQSHRRQGVASLLVNELKRMLRGHEFLSIRARVAEDLAQANAFWAKSGFVVSRRVAGGETTGRKILVRVFELDTPQLFPTSRLSEVEDDNLGLVAADSQVLPLYLVDLNVLFDVAHQRPSHGDAVSLIRLAHLGEYRLAMSDEAGRELDRTATPGRPDPMRGLIESIPRAALIAPDEANSLIEEVARLIFPEKEYPTEFKRNDLSDARHFATAILHNAAGFVTRDDRVVRVADKLRERFGVSVLSVVDFLRPAWSEEQKVQLDFGKDDSFEISRYCDSDASFVREFLLAQGVAPQDVAGKWVPVSLGERLGKRVVARIGDQVVGISSWQRIDREEKEVFISMAVDESASMALALSDAMLTLVISECSQFGLTSLSLEIPVGQIAAKEAALGYGFRGELSGVLRKVAAHAIVGPGGWNEFRASAKRTARLTLPDTMPEWKRYLEPQQLCGADGERRFLTFRDLESLLSPVLFALAGRPGLLVPIRKKYLERLLGSGQQLSFGPKLRAELSRQRVYLGDPRTLSRYIKGGLLFFYESGSGSKAVVAVARVVDAFLIRRDREALDSLSQSVLTPETLKDIGKAENKAACLFDNPLWLPMPVPIEALRNVGISNGQLITALTLSEEQTRILCFFGGVA